MRPFIYTLLLACVSFSASAAGQAQSSAPSAAQSTATAAGETANAAVEPWAAPDFSVDPKTLYEATSAVPVPDGANVIELVEDERYTFDDEGRMNHVGRII